MPGRNAPPLSFESVLALQSLDAPKPPAPPSAADLFLQEAQKSPIERMREQILEELGLTEESIAQLPPEEKRAVEDKIRRMIEEKIRQAMGADEAPAASNAAMLQTIA